MKHLIRRGLSAALAVLMAASLLSGCGSNDDPVKDIMGYKGSTVMFTVNGQDVIAEEYLFWLAQQADSAYSYLSMMQKDDQTSVWDTEIEEGKTAGDSIKEAAQKYAIMYSVVEAKGKEAGYDYTSEDKAAYQEDLANAKKQLSTKGQSDGEEANAEEQSDGEEQYAKYLKSMCISDKGMEKVNAVRFIHNHMVEGMFQDGKETAPTAEELTKYAEDNDLLAAKHILLLTKDMTTGAELSDSEKAEKKTRADELLKELQAITDPAKLEAKFDELMNANSEDSGLGSNPDGYVFTAGEMVEAFESATRALKPGQVSGIVESDYGYHIILRLDPATSKAFREEYAVGKIGEMEQQWVEEAEIKTTETYDNLSVADFYDKLTAYRESMNTDAAETEAENQEVQQDTGNADAADAGSKADANAATDAEAAAKASKAEAAQKAMEEAKAKQQAAEKAAAAKESGDNAAPDQQ